MVIPTQLICLFGIVSTVVAQMIYPTDGTVWKVGQSASASFKPGQVGETVNLFFDNARDSSLGGGPIEHTGATFQFIVPSKAISPAGGSSELVAVHRVLGRLQSVDSIKVLVVL